ncbi:MAG: hypothetical protein Q8K75_09660 [Chlamydiales bacterium]|nr:hypothetical protein [Chlamydiales bacterium]
MGKLAKSIANDLLKYAKEHEDELELGEEAEFEELDIDEGFDAEDKWDDEDDLEEGEEDDEDSEEYEEGDEDDEDEDSEFNDLDFEDSVDDYDLYLNLFEYPMILGGFLLQCHELLDKYPELRQHQMYLAGSLMEYANDEEDPWGIRTFFDFWSFFDAQVGNTGETLATVVRETAISDGNEIGIDILNIGINSRMGLYQYKSSEEGTLLLEELVTGEQVHIASAYPGQEGEVWFIRTLPPLDHPVVHTLVTEPFVFSPEQLPAVKQFATTIAKGSTENYTNFLKHGPTPSYWLDYLNEVPKVEDESGIILLGHPPKI